MSTLKEILQIKGRNVITVPPSTSVFDAIRIMAQRNVGALLVVEDEELIGLFSERDYLRKIALKFRSSRKTAISEVMSSPVLCANVNDDLDHCMGLMTKHRYRHLPILENDSLAGIISIGDVVKYLLHAKEQELEQLSSYIAGAY